MRNNVNQYFESPSKKEWLLRRTEWTEDGIDRRTLEELAMLWIVSGGQIRGMRSDYEERPLRWQPSSDPQIARKAQTFMVDP